MKGLICIGFVFFVFVTKGNGKKNEEIEADENVSGEEVLLTSLTKEEREQYEKYLEKAVLAYNGFILGHLYNLRSVDETTFRKGERIGHFALSFFIHCVKCTLNMRVIQEIDGTEAVVPDEKGFNIFRPVCGLVFRPFWG